MMKFKKTKPTASYDAYARIYDEFKGDRQETINRLKALIAAHNPAAQTALDLACGTGSIAQGLADSYSIVGIDNAPAMLLEARKKLPNMPFLQANIIDFKLDQTFDVAYCLHNSVNHLLEFADWQQLFANVARHLKSGGIFIFDIITIEKLDTYTRGGMGALQVGQNYVLTKVSADKDVSNFYYWDVKIMSRQKGNAYHLEHERIKIRSYSIDQVYRALLNKFSNIEISIVEISEKDEDIGRAYFIGHVSDTM